MYSVNMERIEEEKDSCIVCNGRLHPIGGLRKYEVEYCDVCKEVAKSEFAHPTQRLLVFEGHRKKTFCKVCEMENLRWKHGCYMCDNPNGPYSRLWVEIGHMHRVLFTACEGNCYEKLITHVKKAREGYCNTCELHYPSYIKLRINRYVDRIKTHPFLVRIGIYERMKHEIYTEECNK